MSTHVSDVDLGSAASPPEATGPPPAFGPGGSGADDPPEPLQQPLRSFWQRPRGIVTIVAIALATSLAVIAGFLVLAVGGETSPELRQVRQEDFTTMPESGRTDGDGLSWQTSGGRLNLYPTDNDVHWYRFRLPESSDAVRVEATLTQPAFAGEGGLLWGVKAYDSSTNQGVALLCTQGGTMAVADPNSFEILPGTLSQYPCEETMSMSLEVNGAMVVYGPASEQTLYFGDVEYGPFDSVAIAVAAEKPDQVLKVSKITAYQR